MARWQRRLLGLLSLGGGAIGFAAATELLLTQARLVEWLFTAVFAAIYASGIWWGIRLFERASDAPQWLFWYWVLQVPAFATPIASYSMTSGFQLTGVMGFAPLDVEGMFMLGSQFTWSLLQLNQPWKFGVNFFALAIAWWLWRKLVDSEALPSASSRVPAPAPMPES